MRLKSIRLSGFKSFVEPTEIILERPITAVAGPNGCGKSNIVDGVRWAIGESSARFLRGDEIADVIFRGTESRHAASRASVEMIFDNQDGTLGGEFSEFSEISIRRDVTVDAPSAYYINNHRCRRKDVRDLFRGTGFGARSYSIIEQGLIGELADASPQEMRGHIEEASGVSVYRERRRESENKIDHTSANLDQIRVQQKELKSQVNRLKRQTRDARKYRELQEEARRVSAMLMLTEVVDLESGLEELKSSEEELTTQLETLDAEFQAMRASLESLRRNHEERSVELERAQASVYDRRERLSELRSEVTARREQLESIATRDAALLEQFSKTVAQEQQDGNRVKSLEREQAELISELHEIQAQEAERDRALTTALTEQRTLQQRWDELRQLEIENVRGLQACESDIAAEERSLSAAQEVIHLSLQHLSSVPGPAAGPSDAGSLALAQARVASLDSDLERNLTDLKKARVGCEEAEVAAAKTRDELHAAREHLAAAQAALQQVDDADRVLALEEWLKSHGLHDAPALGAGLQVRNGWHRAVESVLGDLVRARHADTLDLFAVSGLEFPSAALAVSESPAESGGSYQDSSLATVAFDADDPARHLVGHALVANSLQDALNLRGSLAPGHIYATREGLLIGPCWLRKPRSDQEGMPGLLEAARTIGLLKSQASSLEEQLADERSLLGKSASAVEALTGQREELLRERERSTSVLHDLRVESELQAEARKRDLERREKATADHARAKARALEATDRLGELRSRLDLLTREQQQLGERHSDLAQRRERDAKALEEAQARRDESRNALHEIDLKMVRSKAAASASREALTRADTAKADIERARSQLNETRTSLMQSVPTLERELEQAEHQLADSELAVQQLVAQRDGAAQEIQELGLDCQRRETSLAEMRAKIQGVLVSKTEAETNLVHATRRFEARRLSRTEVKQAMSEFESAERIMERLDEIEDRISKFSDVNLAAAKELDRVSARKVELDSQIDDLESALETLHEAIRKIDRETVHRFRETMERLNANLSAVFKRMFAGGDARLELDSTDLLVAGVDLVARPPGKSRISTQMLSGGEKALAALALVFAIFRLNPSPVCVLDEVDAPLDDVNVVRVVSLLKELSREIQFLIVTHNRATMEGADALLGVTMQEAGVSRLVSVDLERAVAMAAA